jgi:hypothetical protein
LTQYCTASGGVTRLDGVTEEGNLGKGRMVIVRDMAAQHASLLKGLGSKPVATRQAFWLEW